ncbi:Predicted DNA-binding transcriptional regulator YafY, contains an HTH and WYL domains [Methylobacterium sp. ap11]|jgi:predicted DNA-binding transcriptional regulator YafY|uniref:helix-turn-helix transcriptional regulator n=1 Tax=Methylobacterium sp. ap11 TaxID=1761799 RepID=UPI0008D4A703|nr:YafY family protein [Methylobacterium sp. ap11]SEO69605.1 Predicted DNA-binding transcriptional regulator YafY, contains an HTH and WYL domains [Methylobacterium sp. ap11]
MSRAERLLDLMQVLRRHRGPVSGRHLAQETGVSLRTLYRDIASLQAQGAAIEGEPGLGYVLRPGFTLPPLMFREEEIEALVLGMRWVAARGDDPLAAAAGDALAKIAAVLPQALRERLDTSTLIVGPAEAVPECIDLAALRGAIRAQHKVTIRYRDAGGAGSERVIWPFALGFFERVRVVVAWCEIRDDFRHFRTDRMEALTLTRERYPRGRPALLRDWRAAQSVASKKPRPC